MAIHSNILPGKFHGQRSLVSYRGRKVLDMTEQLTHIHTQTYTQPPVPEELRFPPLVAQRLKCLPTIWETWVRSLGQEDPLEKEMATHSSILAWRIPWTEEPGGLPSMGSQSWTRLSDFTHFSTSHAIHWGIIQLLALVLCPCNCSLLRLMWQWSQNQGYGQTVSAGHAQTVENCDMYKTWRVFWSSYP